MIVITVARKPLEGTMADNSLKPGTGGLNIDACRIEMFPEEQAALRIPEADGKTAKRKVLDSAYLSMSSDPNIARESARRTRDLGRWPANLIVSEGVSLPDGASRFFWHTEEAAPRQESALWHTEE